jgi:hypothetical protein
MAAGIFQLGAAAGKVLLCGLQNNGQGHKTIKATVHTDKKKKTAIVHFHNFFFE